MSCSFRDTGRRPEVAYALSRMSGYVAASLQGGFLNHAERYRLEAYCGADEFGDAFGSAVRWPGDDGRDCRRVRYRHDGVLVAQVGSDGLGHDRTGPAERDQLGQLGMVANLRAGAV